MRSRHVFDAALYSTPPYIRSRLLFDAALYSKSTYIRRHLVFVVDLYSTPSYISGRLIFDAALYAGSPYIRRHLFIRRRLINIDIETCEQATCVTCHKTLYGCKNNWAWMWNGMYYRR